MKRRREGGGKSEKERERGFPPITIKKKRPNSKVMSGVCICVRAHGE